MNIKTNIPWLFKIIAKIILSELPVNYSFWRLLNIFRHGAMEEPAYAFNIFKKHFKNYKNKKTNFVALELGPGDSLFSALTAHAFGSKSFYLIDTRNFAQNDIRYYKRLATYLINKGFNIPDLAGIKNLNDYLSLCNAQYYTSGLNSFQLIEDGSIDFIYSQAVLEHIKKADFLNTMIQLRRVIKPDGACSHTIDLQDHLGGSLNNLRFKESTWESDIISNAGFYTNRIRYNEMLNLFYKAGFKVKVIKVKKWKKLPLPKSKMSKQFKILSSKELCVSGFDVILKPDTAYS